MINQPQYIKLYETLKRKIVTGEFPEGDLLPSEHQLTTAYKVARSTVRQALQHLVNDGYIQKKQGVGSIVTSPVKSLGLLSFKGFSDVVGKTSKNIQTKIITRPEERPWNDGFFYPLTAEEKKAGCIYIERIRIVDKEPVMLEHTYLPNLGIGDICFQAFINNSLFQTLNVRYQIEINNLNQDLRAVKADLYVAEKLGIQQHQPVLHIYRRYYTTRPEFRVYSSLYCNTLKYAIGSYH